MKKNDNIKRPVPHEVYRDTYNDSLRRLNPDKTDEELGINNLSYYDVINNTSFDLFRNIKNCFLKFINW